MPIVTLNSLDNDKNIVDTTNLEIPLDGVSDIIDQAANLIIAMQDNNKEDMEYYLTELEEVLTIYDVIREK